METVENKKAIECKNYECKLNNKMGYCTVLTESKVLFNMISCEERKK